MAVIGNPRCVFLDEPTTGLDPNTRRFVWDYILELKENRAVVLTTHSMEEADALCARIGIMVNGKLKTLGTPQQLKAQYGTGYGMIIRLKGDVENDTEILEKILKEKFGEDCTLDDIVSTATYRAYRISQGELDFGDLFRSLEENKEAFGLLDYSITQTTMDQVFKNFAKFQLGE
jgi:ATP-binding cassette subfamily A (ABC1) protein 3